jgi:hypothetical protein
MFAVLERVSMRCTLCRPAAQYCVAVKLLGDDHDMWSTSGVEIGESVQPYQLLQAARSALAEAVSCGARLVAALQQQPAEDVASALAATPLPAAPAKKKGKTAANAAATGLESCPIRCTCTCCCTPTACDSRQASYSVPLLSLKGKML